MAMSPSRMPQPQNMMGAHSNNMMGQAPTQNQFLPQNQFPASSGAMNVNTVGMSQSAAQAGVSQVEFIFCKMGYLSLIYSVLFFVYPVVVLIVQVADLSETFISFTLSCSVVSSVFQMFP